MKFLSPTCLVAVLFCACCHKQAGFDEGVQQVKYIVVNYMENHSFDNLYCEFPGANGLSNATPQNYRQVEAN